MPFIDFQGLLDSGTYRLVVASNPVYISFFKVRKISLFQHYHKGFGMISGFIKTYSS
jgi:hypothetical protein